MIPWLVRYIRYRNQSHLCDCGCGCVMHKRDMIEVTARSPLAREEFVTPWCYGRIYLEETGEWYVRGYFPK